MTFPIYLWKVCYIKKTQASEYLESIRNALAVLWFLIIHDYWAAKFKGDSLAYFLKIWLLIITNYLHLISHDIFTTSTIIARPNTLSHHIFTLHWVKNLCMNTKLYNNKDKEELSTRIDGMVNEYWGLLKAGIEEEGNPPLIFNF